MADYNPEHPVLTLAGVTSGAAVGKDLYGVSDATGLGPNGANKYISYDIVIGSIGAQDVGDASLRKSLGLNTGGQYTGIDIKVGDWVASNDGIYVMKITAISTKSDTSISCTVEDVGMSIAKARSDRSNVFPDGTAVVVFEAGDEREAIIAINKIDQFASGAKLLAVEQYYKVYRPFQRFTFYPSSSSNLSIGDYVKVTHSAAPYQLVTASQDDPQILGTVSDLYGGNNVNVRPFNKIVTNFDAPQLISYGYPGAVWHLSGSNNYTTSSANDAKPTFYQLTNFRQAEVTGSAANPTFNETQYNLEINGVDVIPQNGGGSTLTIEQITQSINLDASQTLVSSSIRTTGGGFASATNSGTLAYGASNFHSANATEFAR